MLAGDWGGSDCLDEALAGGGGGGGGDSGAAVNIDEFVWGGDDGTSVDVDGGVGVVVCSAPGSIDVGGGLGVGIGSSVDASGSVDGSGSVDVGSATGSVCVVCGSGDGGTPSRAVWNNIRVDVAVDDVKPQKATSRKSRADALGRHTMT